MNVSNDIHNSNMHDSYQKNTGHNVEVQTYTFLLDGSDDDEVGTKTTKKKKTSWNRMKQILMVAGGSSLLLFVAAILASHVVLTATTTPTEVKKGASVRTNPWAALLEFGRGDTGAYYQPYCPEFQTDHEWRGNSNFDLTLGPLDDVQCCFTVKGSDQHCYSDNANIEGPPIGSIIPWYK